MISGFECFRDGEELCKSCNPGFHLSDGKCVKNTCFCEHGKPAEGQTCLQHGAEVCIEGSCDENYNWYETAAGGTCTQNGCHCVHGTGVKPADCNAATLEKCIKCNKGWDLDKRTSKCIQNSCTCKHGMAKYGRECTESSEMC